MQHHTHPNMTAVHTVSGNSGCLSVSAFYNTGVKSV